VEKTGDQCSWGTLREKGWLRDMVNKRTGQDRLNFLLSYKRALPLRNDWGTMCCDTVRAFTDKLINECHGVGGPK
jgi:hypothetical protein